MHTEQGIISKEEIIKATQIGRFPLPALAGFIMEVMKITDLNEAFVQIKHLEGIDFINKVLEVLDITIEFDTDDLKNIPTNGGFIALANHPYGGIEGLVLLKILYESRPDVKLMANFLLKKIPGIRDFIIAVNPFENQEYGSNVSGLKNALQQLQDGMPLGIFPAGEVSSFQPGTLQLTDKAWHPVVGKLITKANVPVLPVYFHGNNGLLFNLLGLLHPNLRTAKLPSELLNKKGHVLKLRIGKPIAPEDTAYAGHPRKLLAYFRARTYVLGAGIESTPGIFNPKNIFSIEKKPKAITSEIPVQLLENEIKYITRQYSIYTEKNYEVFIAPALLIPNILKEIGRLREITFRAIGEGTNNETDLDRYDAYYHHLFIWDKEGSKLVGAYRIGKGDEIFAAMGKYGFYTAELFKIKKEFNAILKQSLELGRSWIRKEYQQKPLPLYLLWKGILIYLTKNPRCAYLIGPVSISNTFSKFSQSLLVDYIKRHHFDENLARYVKPRKRFKPDFSNIDKDLLMADKESLKSLDNLISEIEVSHMKVPVMLRQYVSLN
ncbi:MAG: lysophospholipid acyltransferase family protein, partial [Pyrinomonadaceae bacterium]|nr:lysophospholipid acyltransferase family protein [Sphingobacteriaceae bacterium]